MSTELCILISWTSNVDVERRLLQVLLDYAMEFMRSWTFYHQELWRIWGKYRWGGVYVSWCAAMCSYVQLLLLYLRPLRRVTMTIHGPFSSFFMVVCWKWSLHVRMQHNATTRWWSGIGRIWKDGTGMIIFLYLWVIIVPSVLSAVGTNQLSASKGSMWPVPISWSSREKDWGLHLCIAFDLHRFYADSCRSSLPHSHHDANGQRLCILRRAMPCGTAIRSKNVLGNLVQWWAKRISQILWSLRDQT